jgi:hypothetical protein
MSTVFKKLPLGLESKWYHKSNFPEKERVEKVDSFKILSKNIFHNKSVHKKNMYGKRHIFFKNLTLTKENRNLPYFEFSKKIP